jgi:hypothetical protein
MEFRAPTELRQVGHDRIAVIFAAIPTEPDFKLPANFHHVPAWAMAAVVVSELKGEIQWLPAHLVYYVGRNGELVVPPGGEFCTPMKMYGPARYGHRFDTAHTPLSGICGLTRSKNALK